MKKNIIKTALAGMALAAVFTGCFNPVNLADTKNEVEKYNNTVAKDRYANGYETAGSTGSISVGSETLWAGADYKKANTFTITVTAKATVTKEVFKEAIAFYGLKDNTNNKNYPAMLDGSIAYEIIDYVESVSGTNVVQTATLDVNLKSYKVKSFAIRADATKLKDVKGSFLLNGDGNETAGEATDSYTTTKSVTAVPGSGVTLTTLTSSSVMPVRNFGSLNLTVNNTVKTNKDDAKIIEGIEVSVGALVKSYSTDVIPVPTYITDLAATCNGMFKAQTIAPGANAWTDVNLTFSYDDTAKAYKAVLPVSAITVGTKYRFVRTNDPSLSIPNDIYGMPYVTTYSKKKTYTVYTPAGKDYYTSEFYAKTTDTYITNTAITDASKNYITGNPTTVQRAKMTAAAATATTKDGFGAEWVIDFSEEIAAYNDIIVVNKTTMKKVPSEIIVLNRDNEKGYVNKIAVKITDLTYKPAEVDLYVGPGCTLKENKTNAAQVKFGTGYADWSKFDASGYVQLN